MRLSQRQGLFGGLALLSCAAVLLQILLTRICAALLGHHLALIAASIPFFGAALGGALLHLFPGLARPPRLFARLAYFASAAAALTAIAMIILVQPKWVEAAETMAPGRLSLLFGALALPFVFVGAAIAAAFRHAAGDASAISFWLLLGAAVGVASSVSALYAGAPRAGLIAAVIAGVAAIVFLLGYAPSGAGYSADERRPNSGVVATFALGSAVLLAGDIGAPWLKLPALRWMRLDRVELQRWSERALITVERPAGGLAMVQADGDAKTPILEAKKMPDPHPSELAYALHKERGPVLIVGPGGGADVRRALKAGHKIVHVAEPERVMVDELIRGKYRAFSGDLYDKPEVIVAVSDGRSYARRAGVPFQAIILSLADSYASASVGTLSLTASRLHTVEGVRELIDHLAPSGTLVVTRWEGELERLVSLASAALKSAGAAEPARHLFACSQDRVTSLLLQRAPLTREDITALRGSCRKGRFQEAFAPDIQRSELLKRIAAAPDAALLEGAAPSHPTDLSAPTDDRPFFFHTAKARALSAAVLAPRSLMQNNQALLALLALVAAGLAAALFFLIVPLVGRPSSLFLARGRGARAAALLFFMSLGSGAVFAGAALVQHAAALVGHPAYGLYGALFALLLSAAAGALLTRSRGWLVAALAAGRRAQILTAVLALLAALAGPLFRVASPLPLGGRVAIAAALLALVGALIGSLFPLGVKLVAERAPDLLPLGFALGRAAGLVAIGAGALIAVYGGFSVLFLAGGLAYLVAAIAVPSGGAADRASGAGAADRASGAGAADRASGAGAGSDLPSPSASGIGVDGGVDDR
jgi:hypothetical protein